MAKNAKKPVVNHGKPITAFFARSSKPPPPSLQDTPSSSAGTVTSARSSPGAKTISESVPDSYMNEEPFEGVSKMPTKNLVPHSVSSSQKAERLSTSQVPLIPSNTSSSLKRSRIPDAQSPIKPTISRRPSESLKTTPERRRTKFDSDSDVEMSSMVVYVTSMPNPQRRKKARLSPSDDESQPVIPSSQSDEEELTFDATIPVTPRSLNKHRVCGILLTPENDKKNEMMPIDSGRNTRVGEQASAFNKSASRDIHLRKNPPSTDQMLTPPLSNLPSMPPTPKIVDAAQKIAELRAEALAEATSSPEPTPVEFKEQLDSSSDEEDIVVPVAKQKKKTNPNSESCSNEPTKHTIRYSLRNRSPPSPSNGSRSKAFTSQLGQSKATSPDRVSTKRNFGKKEISNPFAALLKEKKAAEKRGAGDEAFRLAEMTARNLEKYQPTDDIDVDGDDEVDWDAATRSARDMESLIDGPSTLNAGPNGSSLMALAEEDRKTLFGAIKGKGNGNGLVNILEQDKVTKREAELSETKPGIQLWSSLNDESNDAENGMVVDSISLHQLSGDSAVIRLFNTCLQRNDISQATMLLDMDFMLLVALSERSLVASFMCDLALSSQSGILGESATRALDFFWSSTSEPLDSTISFARIVNTIHHLGGEPSVLNVQKWSVPSSHQLNYVDPLQRAIIIGRLVLLVEYCACSKRLVISEIPNIVVALLLIGMDSEASPDLAEDVTRVVDLACNCVPTEDIVFERDLCSKILHCIGSYEPINKARLISLLSAGAGVTRKVANVVAHCVITDKPCPKKGLSFDLPPLPEVIDQLIPDSDTPGKFSLHEQTNYDDIGFYTFILGVAVSKIREYVIHERSPESKASRAEGLLKTGEKPQTDLQVVRNALESLHNKISDTRAAHLERSRAKAAIKGLSMGIYYQREDCLRNDPETRSKTLNQYFKKKDKP